MSALEAWGYGILLVAGTALVTVGICMRWSRLWVRRLSMHEGYVRGWDACSRVRDREDVQARKAERLSGVVKSDSDRTCDISNYS